MHRDLAVRDLEDRIMDLAVYNGIGEMVMTVHECDIGFESTVVQIWRWVTVNITSGKRAFDPSYEA